MSFRDLPQDITDQNMHQGVGGYFQREMIRLKFDLKTNCKSVKHYAPLPE